MIHSVVAARHLLAFTKRREFNEQSSKPHAIKNLRASASRFPLHRNLRGTLLVSLFCPPIHPMSLNRAGSPWPLFLLSVRVNYDTIRRGVSVAICEIIAIKLMTSGVISFELKIDTDRLQSDGGRGGRRGCAVSLVLFIESWSATRYRGEIVRSSGISIDRSVINSRRIRLTPHHFLSFYYGECSRTRYYSIACVGTGRDT